MGLLLGFVCLKPSPLGRHPKWWMKAAWAERSTEADLMFRAYWVMPSGPFKAEAFSELSRRARFRERRRKLRVWVFVLTLRLRKGAYSGARKFAGVLKSVLMLEWRKGGGSLALSLSFLLVLVCTLLGSQSWYSSLKLIFSNI